MTRSLCTMLLAVMLLSIVALFPCVALAAEAIPKNDPTSGGLVEEPKRYDGKVVTFSGEAIGEAMVRGGRAWIHLNDDAYMDRNVEEGAALGGYNSGMAVWVPADLANAIDTYGDYKHEGSIVRVRGVFNAACAEHGGDMDIHADSVEVLRPGHAVVDAIPPWKPILALILTAAAAALWVAERATRTRVTPHRGV